MEEFLFSKQNDSEKNLEWLSYFNGRKHSTKSSTYLKIPPYYNIIMGPVSECHKQILAWRNYAMLK